MPMLTLVAYLSVSQTFGMKQSLHIITKYNFMYLCYVYFSSTCFDGMVKSLSMINKTVTLWHLIALRRIYSCIFFRKTSHKTHTFQGLNYNNKRLD